MPGVVAWRQSARAVRVPWVAERIASLGLRRVWEGAFSSEAHYNRSLTLLNDFVYDPDDWILVADSDEFQEYNGQSAR